MRATPKKLERLKWITYEKMERRVEEMVNGELLMVNEKMKKWKEVKFEDLYLEPSRNGLSRPTHVRGSGIKMVNMKEIFSYDLISNVNMELVPVNDKEIELMTLKEGDLLFARQSLVLEGAGKISYVKKLSEPTTFESHIIRVRLNHAIVDSLFYYYYFKTPYANMKSIVQQCAQSGIRGSDLKNLRIPLPPLPTQQRIAAILSAYDDLIENNRRRITLLEDSARLLYKEWFVKFQFPGHEKVKVKNGLPEGWERVALSKICLKITDGKHGDCKNEENSGFYFISSKDIKDEFINYENARQITEDDFIDSNKRTTLEPFDILLTNSGTIGRMALAPENEIVFKTTFQKSVAILKPNRDEINPFFLYYSLSHLKENLINISSGSAQKNLLLKDLRDFKIVRPSNPNDITVIEFGESIRKIFRQKTLLYNQTQKLREARNILLPKLMNGTIEV